MTLSTLLTGYALDPSVDIHQVSSSAYIGAVDEAEKNKGNNQYCISRVDIRLCKSNLCRVM